MAQIITEENLVHLANYLDEGDIILYAGGRAAKIHKSLAAIKDRFSFQVIDCQNRDVNSTITDINNCFSTSPVPHINLLILDIAEPEAEKLLRNCREYLNKQSIDYIWLDCGREDNDSLTDYLGMYGYKLFYIAVADKLIQASGAQPVPNAKDYGLQIVVSERLTRYVNNDRKGMFNYATLFKKHDISPQGVIHIGAHHGEEVGNYRAAGVKRIVMVEADPDNYRVLLENYGADSGVDAILALISDTECETEFHRMSSSQSSSMLNLKEHSRIYKSIKKTETLKMHTTTLDRLVVEQAVDINKYNILALDIQGAELKALHGARTVLESIDAIITEVNYKELYEGSALIWELDEYLSKFGFKRVETVSPHHPSWGDALYIKNEVIQ